MQLSKLAIAITMAIVGFTNAAPAEEMEGRAPVTVETLDVGYVWEHPDKGGRRWRVSTFRDCTSYRRRVQNDKISYIEVEAGATCRFYRNYFCDKNMLFGQGGVAEARGPFSGNVPSKWHDVISSYKCFYH